MENGEGNGRSRSGKRLVLILAIIAAIIAATIVIGTIYALARGTARSSPPAGAVTGAADRTAYYSDLGEIRCATADPSHAVVVVRISLPYDSGDLAFAEELTKKRRELHDAAVAFFASKTVAELHPSKEAGLKRGLKEAFNGRLILGKLTEVLFTDFAIIP